MGIVYCISCIHNQEKYIGSTTQNLKKRYTTHLQYSKRKETHSHPLYVDMRKYGRSGFVVGIVEENIPQDTLLEREQYWKDRYGTYNRNQPNKEWLVYNKKGEQYVIHNLKKFCREHNLYHSSLQLTQTGRRFWEKGYRVIPQEPSQIREYMENRKRTLQGIKSRYYK